MTLERGELTFVVKAVPAAVCQNCGEEYVDPQTTARVLAMAEEAAPPPPPSSTRRLRYVILTVDTSPATQSPAKGIVRLTEAHDSRHDAHCHSEATRRMPP